MKGIDYILIFVTFIGDVTDEDLDFGGVYLSNDEGREYNIDIVQTIRNYSVIDDITVIECHTVIDIPTNKETWPENKFDLTTADVLSDESFKGTVFIAAESKITEILLSVTFTDRQINLKLD